MHCFEEVELEVPATFGHTEAAMAAGLMVGRWSVGFVRNGLQVRGRRVPLG